MKMLAVVPMFAVLVIFSAGCPGGKGPAVSGGGGAGAPSSAPAAPTGGPADQPHPPQPPRDLEKMGIDELDDYIAKLDTYLRKYAAESAAMRQEAVDVRQKKIDARWAMWIKIGASVCTLLLLALAGLLCYKGSWRYGLTLAGFALLGWGFWWFVADSVIPHLHIMGALVTVVIALAIVGFGIYGLYRKYSDSQSLNNVKDEMGGSLSRSLDALSAYVPSWLSDDMKARLAKELAEVKARLIKDEQTRDEVALKSDYDTLRMNAKANIV